MSGFDHANPFTPEFDEHAIPDEPPPILGRWPRVYTFVLVYLVVLIAILWTITARLAP
jgi:hypothetical protein